jgi:hypothetical protein
MNRYYLVGMLAIWASMDSRVWASEAASRTQVRLIQPKIVESHTRRQP